MLAKTVYVWIGWQLGFDAEILGFEDERVTSCCEQHLIGRSPIDRKRKWRRGIVELNGG